MTFCDTCRSADPQFCNGGCQSETPEQADMTAALETGDLVADFGDDDYETYAGTMPASQFIPLFFQHMNRRRYGCDTTVRVDGTEYTIYAEARV